ncbi:MAG: beta-ketoacyl-[acyl-carrier-protein] synthase family protein [Deltaproteobacteria bacterium]|nr:beta-ketoacyl-[acyl-carrier-protein] synthase family protein [Deltaproteobacteria bacterium]
MIDEPGRLQVAISAVGVCCPLGRSVNELWVRIASGEHGFRQVERFPLPGIPSRMASAFDADAVRSLCEEADASDPVLAFAVLAGRAALDDADLGPAQLADTVLVMATSAGAADTHDRYDRLRHTALDAARDLLGGGAFSSLASELGDRLGLAGPRTMVSTACSSGGHALGIGSDLVRSGAAQRVLVVGSDAVHPSLFAGFHSVGALAPGPCAPFGEVFGMALGEGAAAVLLEPVDSAGSVLGVLEGWGGSSDAYHPTSPDPRGAGMGRSLSAALADAGRSAAEVGYYNAHGTGTEANDSAETFAVRGILGDELPVSATKSQIGHTQGAAGLLEAVVTLEALRRQAVPPTLRCMPARRIAPADPVAGGRARNHRFSVALSHSAAFGGTNVTVVLGREPSAKHGGAPSIRVYARGVGAAGPFGASVGAALDPSFLVDSTVAPGSRSRRVDRVSALLTEAMGRACAEAGFSALADSGDRVAMVVGMGDGPQESMRRFVHSRDQRGLAHASAAAFARMVFNAPAGAASIALQLRGPSLTLWSGVGAGTQAVLVGARLLRCHPDVQAVVAAGADEVGHIIRDRQRLDTLPGSPIEASGALYLAPSGGDAVLLGSGWGTPEAWRDVVRRACRGAVPDRIVVVTDRAHADVGSPWPDRPVWRPDLTLGHAPAAGGTLASVAAVEWIRAGVCERVLVVSVARDSGTSALLWAAPAWREPGE